MGGSAFTVAAGKSARVKIKLSRKGLRLLKRRKRISAQANITVTRAGKRTAKTVKVTLQAPPAALLTSRSGLDVPRRLQASHEQALRERAP